MQITEEIRPGAGRYISESGALESLRSLVGDFAHPIVVTGQASYRAFQSVYQQELQWAVYRYDGSASDEDAQRIATDAGRADVVIGIGGGRVLDTAKVVAEDLNADMISVPTLASNCAPYTPIGAIYNESEHSFKRVAYFRRPPYATVVDWRLILTTPHDYFVAGIGDTLAKWYEMAGITRNRVEQLPVFGRLMYATSREIRDTLQRDAVHALADLDAGRDTAAFEDVANCIIGLAGDVGGFGVADGRQAGAHAVHNGLTTLPETNPILHGSKVAYGILVQLAESGDTDEIAALMPFYHSVGLPTNLAAVNVDAADTAKITQIAQRAASAEEAFVLINPDITPNDVVQDIATVEQITKA